MKTDICAQTGQLRDFAAEKAEWVRKQQSYTLASRALKQDEIYRICARYELESDEFFTREQKAQAIIDRY